MEFSKDTFYKIQGDCCGTRIIAALYKIGDKYLFFDVGWLEASLNPLHWIGIKIKENKYEIIFRDDESGARTFMVSPIVQADGPMLEDAIRWGKYCLERENVGPALEEQIIREAYCEIIGDQPITKII